MSDQDLVNTFYSSQIGAYQRIKDTCHEQNEDCLNGCHGLRLLTRQWMKLLRRHQGEIVSQKATDLDKIQESTYRGYLSEIELKYSHGTKIRSNTHPHFDGMKLDGKYILEIPASNKDLPNIQDYIDIAAEYDVELRFTEE